LRGSFLLGRFFLGARGRFLSRRLRGPGRLFFAASREGERRNVLVVARAVGGRRFVVVHAGGGFGFVDRCKREVVFGLKRRFFRRRLLRQDGFRLGLLGRSGFIGRFRRHLKHRRRSTAVGRRGMIALAGLALGFVLLAEQVEQP